MGLLDELLGGGPRQTQYRDFIDRFQRGKPYDSLRDQEVVDRYHEVAPELSREDYRASAQETFAQMSPQERAEFSRWLRTNARNQGVAVQDYDLNDDGIDDRAQRDPGQLAELTARVHDGEPNIFEQLFGKGDTGGRFDNPLAKVAVAGIAAMAAQRLMAARR